MQVGMGISVLRRAAKRLKLGAAGLRIHCNDKRAMLLPGYFCLRKVCISIT